MTGRHAFPARFTDAPSIQPERVPARRGKHRGDWQVDGCRGTDAGCSGCLAPDGDFYEPRHRAAERKAS